MKPDLGRRMHARGWVLRGRLSLPRWRGFLIECAAALGMEPAGEAATWKYPFKGKGGSGHTVVQPITESFLALDTWPDHDGAYLFVCSCRDFVAAKLAVVIALYGLDHDDMTDPMVLRLDPEGP